jgi:FMN phosphatase YigB (HAD superfamily)
MAKLKNIQACVFDAYGTLFDVHSTIGRFKARVGTDADRVSQLWRQNRHCSSSLQFCTVRYLQFNRPNV